MQKLYTFFLAFVAFVFCQHAWGQQLLVQDFNFSGALTANGWTAHSGAGVSPVSTTAGLSYPGYAGSGVGNAALVASVAGEDVNIGFTSQNTNGQSIYFAFLVNVTEAGTSKSGDFFFHTGLPTSGTSFSNFAGRVFTRVSGANVNFGVSNTTTVTYGTTNFAKNTTYLLVMKYTINTSGSDAVSLWVLSSGVPASEAAAGTAEAVSTSTAGTDAVSAVALRQGSTTQPQTVVDGIRVGNTWADAVQPSGGAVNSITTGAITTPPFCVDGSTTATGTVAYTANGTYNTTFTAYLSDASGSFGGLPLPVGSTTVNSTNPSGTIPITIPAGTASGTGYKIRVEALSPVVIGTASTAFEIVNGAKNVTGASAFAGNAQALVSWTNPTACFDEVLVVAKASSAVTGTPSGNGSSYTASAAFGSGTPFDGGYVVYKGTASTQTVTGLTNGTLYYFKVFTRKGTAWSSGVEASTTPAFSTQLSPGDIVINQLSPKYSSNTDDEYIELVNKTNSPINLFGLTIRYQSAAGNPNNGNLLATLSGTILPRRYWLLSPNTSVTVGQTNNLASDGTYTAGMATAAGQIALVRTSDNTIIDAVGYGGAANVTINPASPFTETAAAPATPTNGGIKRSPDGTDNNDNSSNFVTVANAAIFLRSSSFGAALPVTFSNLKAVQKGTSVYVSWSSASEAGIRYYTVERSANAIDFVSIAKLNPAGNLQAATNYEAVDAFPAKGLNYYRIRSTQTDGKQSFSNVLKLNTANTVTSLAVYPNPVHGAAAILQLSNLSAGQYVIRVIGVDGHVFSTNTVTFTEGTSVETLSLSRLPAGLYTVQASGPLLLQQTFIKQ